MEREPLVAAVRVVRQDAVEHEVDQGEGHEHDDEQRRGLLVHDRGHEVHPVLGDADAVHRPEDAAAGFRVVVVAVVGVLRVVVAAAPHGWRQRPAALVWVWLARRRERAAPGDDALR